MAAADVAAAYGQFEQKVEGNTKMSTYMPSSHEIARKWFVVDATGKTLGRLATEAASVLAGKRSPKYTPFMDMGDHVIVVNAEKIRLTGLKTQQKIYRRYTGFPGGLREESFVRLIARRPEKVVEEAVQGHVAQEQAGPPDGDQAKGVSRRRPSSPGTAAGGARDC